ncbi:MAG TPA: hypothetical protein VK718_03360 [Ferruginibacter sp.]|jgi:hypothetical protein|nr:hypothetical protein [Ferruginibacter sp.]
MEIPFDNQQLINSISPNIDMINKLTTQRNWAIRTAIFIGVVFTFYIIIEENKKQTPTTAS